MVQVTTGQGSIMHFEDALRLQQEDSEQRKKGKKGKQLPVSGGSEDSGTATFSFPSRLNTN